ncbi:class I SAM-dependent methyltransferase [Ferrimonas marina]|uniref:Methyltransferase domain-containing protein n=1 Tax=Ferrimonas marina TaxID=299255 RepID=A0A1M5ZL25_9GAMM|nr:class I SAM-dependent methyltransferase [Ferrimonas marina]SHI24884.1 Methyltransferase domain-containing protein [Ferrimonas marina]
MRLNGFERLVVNNPVRAWLQHHFETPRLLEMGGRCDGELALEIGGGQGEGARVIQQRFGASEVVSVDLDLAMSQRARQRCGETPGLHFIQADCTALPLPSHSVGALFDFGVIHHVPQWQDAVVELDRIARPGARLYAMEVYRALICHPLWRRVLEHPQHNRFSHDEFIEAWQQQGWQLLGQQTLTQGMGWAVLEKPR